MVRYCASQNCNQSDKGNGVRFFKVPDKEKNPISFQNWQSAAKCPIGKFSFFCSAHFDDLDYAGSSKIRLLPTAFPKIRVAREREENFSADKVTHEVSAVLATDQKVFFVKLGDNLLKINLTTKANSNRSMQQCFTAKRANKLCNIQSASRPKSKYLKRLGSAQYRKKGTLQRPVLQSFWKKAYMEATRKKRSNYIHKQRVARQVRLARKEVKNFYLQRMETCFTKTQINRIVTGRELKWHAQDIALGIRIRYSSHPYDDLRKIGIPLPCPTTLRNYLRQIQFKPGILEPILEIIKQRFNDATPFERQSVLMLDEMGIDPKYEYFDQGDQFLGGKKNVTVFLVRGLFAPWKQIFAFDFCEKLTKSRFLHYIAKLEAAGLIIRNVVSDMGPKNQSLWKSLGIGVVENGETIEVTNYIRSPINNTKICFKADVPHLIKLLRNHTLASGIAIGGESALFKKDFHHLIRAELPNEVKQLFKLTEKHLELSNLDKMKVGPALHVFSFETAAAWSHHFPDRKVEETFIKLMRSTFNCLTSRSPQQHLQAGAPFGLYLIEQTKILQEAFDAVARMRVVGHKSRLPFQNGWLLSIKSTIDDSNELHDSQMNVSYINTGRSTQDALENLFSCIRALGTNRNPSAVEVIRRIRLHTISSAPSISTNVASMIDQDDVPLLSSEMLNELTKNYSTSELNHEQIDSLSLSSIMIENATSHNSVAEMEHALEETSVIESQADPRRENHILEEEAFDYVLGYVAKQLYPKFPELSASREEYDQVPNHWVNKLHKHRANVTLPSKVWRLMGSKLNEAFIKLHGIGSKVSVCVGVHKDFCKKLEVKFPDMPKEAIALFMKIRAKIRLDHINSMQQQKIIQRHNIEKERIERLQKLASELPSFHNNEPAVVESEYEQNEDINKSLFNRDLFAWSSEVNGLANVLLGRFDLRENQKIAINASLTGLDVIANLPTGSGKSAIYYIATLATPGFTVVISPLISLIQDQVGFLKTRNIPAVALYDVPSGESAELGVAIKLLESESLRFLYVTPEKIFHSRTLRELLTNAMENSTWPFKLIVVDEAHCYADWGKSFRKDYLNLVNLKTYWPNVSLIATSATLTPSAIQEFQIDLKIRHPVVIRDSVYRANLKFSVVYCDTDKDLKIYEFVQSRQLQSGIIYCQTVLDCERLAEKLLGFGISCAMYEGNLHTIAKKKILEQWMNGMVKVVISTTAFGLGINKADCRFIIHASLPRNFNDYIQQCGRAGRDGLSAECILFTSLADYVSSCGRVYQDRNGLENLHKILEYSIRRHVCRNQSIGEVFAEEIQCGAVKCDVCSSSPNYFNGKDVIEQSLRVLENAEIKHEKITHVSLVGYLTGQKEDKRFVLGASVPKKLVEQCIFMGLINQYITEVFEYGRFRTFVYLKRGINSNFANVEADFLYALNEN